MDIRTKLVFAMVVMALASMFGLGWALYANTEASLRQRSLDQLDGLAEAKKEGLEQIFHGWIDRVNLVSSRTQLRLSLREYNQARDPETAERITRILSDAVEAVDVIEGLAIYDAREELVAAAGPAVPSNRSDHLHAPHPVAEGLLYQGVTHPGNGSPRVGFVAILSDNSRAIGDLHVHMNAQSILELAARGLGLGESGETLIVCQDDQGVPRVLYRTGYGRGKVWAPTDTLAAGDPVRLALAGEEGLHWQGVRNDEGVPVWSAVRHLPEAGWGLVVMVDAAEGRASLTGFRDRSFRLTLSLGAFAIVLGTLLGFRFSRPILELAEVTTRLKDGELSARAKVEGEDEVSILARNFNEMAAALEGQVTLLQEFQRYFEVSRDMLCIAGIDGYFKRVNPAFRRTLGWTRKQLLRRPFIDFVHPQDVEETKQEMSRLARGLPTIQFENRWEIPQGGYRVLQWTAHPDRDSGLIYAVARDVTQQRKERDALKNEINDLKGQLMEAHSRLGGNR